MYFRTKYMYNVFKQEKHHTHNVTLRRVRLTIAAVERRWVLRVLSVRLYSYLSSMQSPCTFLWGAFAKLRNATISFVMYVRRSVCLSVCQPCMSKLILAFCNFVKVPNKLLFLLLLAITVKFIGKRNARFEMLMQIQIFRDLTPWRLLNSYRRFWLRYSRHLLGLQLEISADTAWTNFRRHHIRKALHMLQYQWQI
jgi:hypothetical protein